MISQETLESIIDLIKENKSLIREINISNSVEKKIPLEGEWLEYVNCGLSCITIYFKACDENNKSS